MKKTVLKTAKILILSLLMIFSNNLTAQVAINDDGTAPNGNTMLDIDFSGTNIKGLLIPRMTTAERTGTFDDAFAASEEGLTVYDTDLHRFYYWNNGTSAWEKLTIQGANWSILGNTSIDPTVNFLGTTDAQPLIFSTNGTERARFLSTGLLGINTTTPDVYFHIFGDDVTTGTDDATYSNGTGLMVLGNISERNLVFDQNEILARNNGFKSSLYLQNRGGDVKIHYDRPTTTHDDGSQFIIKDDGKVGIGFLNPVDMLHIYAPFPYIRFTDKDGGHDWNMGVNGGNTRFQIGEDDGTTYFPHRFVIKEGGNVGIGTVSPEGLLHIKADAGDDADFYIDANAGTDAADTWKIQSAQADNDLNFINDATTNVVFNSAGYVGIGIDPSRVLHINNTLPYIRIQDTDGGNYWEVGNTSGEFRIYESNTDLRFEIEAGGNVGIGTDNPDAKLHVLGGGTVMGQYAGTVAAFQQNNATTDWSRMSIIAGNTGASVIDFGDADKQDPGSIKYDHTDNYMAFFTNNTDERFRITSTGNVGIMVTDPDEVLEVNGAIHIGTTANTNAGTIRWNGSNFQGYDGSTWKALDVQAAGGAGGWTDGGTDVYLTTTSDNVGIGTNSPAEKLDVTGSIRMTDGNQAAGNVMVSDANGTASWSNENDGVKTRVIRQINGGNVKTVIYTHPENIEVSFNPSTELVTVENKSTDATHYWDVTIIGGATGRESVETTNYKADYIRDDGTNDLLSFDLGNNNMGWFDIICSDQADEQDGFIIHVVYFGDDLNGTVQYWDN